MTMTIAGDCKEGVPQFFLLSEYLETVLCLCCEHTTINTQRPIAVIIKAGVRINITVPLLQFYLLRLPWQCF